MGQEIKVREEEGWEGGGGARDCERWGEGKKKEAKWEREIEKRECRQKGKGRDGCRRKDARASEHGGRER